MRPILNVCQSSTLRCDVPLLAGKVYDMTQYIRFHPGGKEELMKGAGIDCSILFDEVCMGASNPYSLTQNSATFLDAHLTSSFPPYIGA